MQEVTYNWYHSRGDMESLGWNGTLVMFNRPQGRLQKTVVVKIDE